MGKEDQMISATSTETESKSETCDQGIVDADDFLQALGKQMQENSIAADCAAELDVIIKEICGDEDPNLMLDEHGTMCRVVTSPPFSDLVVRLFANRPNPVINPRRKRSTAVQVDAEINQQGE
jgi:hypothetical protein